MGCINITVLQTHHVTPCWKHYPLCLKTVHPIAHRVILSKSWCTTVSATLTKLMSYHRDSTFPCLRLMGSSILTWYEYWSQFVINLHYNWVILVPIDIESSIGPCLVYSILNYYLKHLLFVKLQTIVLYRQDKMGQSFCKACPLGGTTVDRGTSDVSNCQGNVGECPIFCTDL